MTLEQIRASTEIFLLAEDVAPLLRNSAPQSIRIQAHKDPAALGFPVTVLGTKTLIPRMAFIKFWEGS